MTVEAPIHGEDKAHPALDLAGELGGVPKPVLRTVFGKQLGGRIWELIRQPRVPRTRRESPGSAEPVCASAPVREMPCSGCSKKMASDPVNGEILRGMIEYLSHRAADTLERNRRLARSVTLTLCYNDGSRQIGTSWLARPTNASAEICEAVGRLFCDLPASLASLAAINLTAGSVEAQPGMDVALLRSALAGASS